MSLSLVLSLVLTGANWAIPHYFPTLFTKDAAGLSVYAFVVMSNLCVILVMSSALLVRSMDLLVMAHALVVCALLHVPLFCTGLHVLLFSTSLFRAFVLVCAVPCGSIMNAATKVEIEQ